MFKEGQQVEVVNDGFGVKNDYYDIGHYLVVGSIAKILDIDVRGEDGEDVLITLEGRSSTDGRTIPQTVRPESIKALVEAVIELPVVEQETVTKASPVPRAKVIYSVEDEEFEYLTTRDRDYAREVKAELGGKRKGVRIIRYVATHEIR